MTFGEKIRSIRGRERLTQQGLADVLFVSRKTVSSWENGRSYPDIHTLIMISDRYNLTLDVLLREDVNMLEKYDQDRRLSQRDEKLFKISYWLNVPLILLTYATFVLPEIPFHAFLTLSSAVVFFVLVTHLPITERKLRKRVSGLSVLFFVALLLLTGFLAAQTLFPITYPTGVSSPTAYAIGLVVAVALRTVVPTAGVAVALLLNPKKDH
ncbi:helix-turn-helix domain-containing protein [Furfurilactobacillus siliginis]|uniref:HTH cro/C1-type domain-containing protein n=1 Tax=Furfurilactobacillus siliginis TaxID=348151 RepID=A0A0R2L1P5_9LACO|nr:helix-turn-helix transcriptional regulator [Furfurilactobacillus siliginis]KRN93765.1 hypothetical protein IV55_GL000954 [Furfurilactobacillus siliginis]GEK28943.1 hypothetical protein LSI01_12540 [Furfurilactobacillus siliginis]